MSTKYESTEPYTLADDPTSPNHYQWHPAGVECYEIAQEFVYNIGTAIAYLWRAGLKTNDPLEDIQKAIKHLQFECARLENKRPGPKN